MSFQIPIFHSCTRQPGVGGCGGVWGGCGGGVGGVWGGVGGVGGVWGGVGGCGGVWGGVGGVRGRGRVPLSVFNLLSPLTPKLRF